MQIKASIILLFCIISYSAKCQGQMETGESVETNEDHCAADDSVAEICLKCSSLTFYSLPTLVTCCSEKSAFLLCEACVNDQDSCKTLMKEIEDVDTFSDEVGTADDYYDDVDGDEENGLETIREPLSMPYPITTTVDKRYGTLFVNRSPKRYGKVFFGKRSGHHSDETMEEMAKRYGRIYMGSGTYFGKRNGIDKRYGRLFSTSNSYFGKRAPNLAENEILEPSYEQDEPDDFEISKRYGRVYMGSRNKMFGKRYGRIFFGKRSGGDKAKRFGQLYLGQNGYLMRNPKYRNMRYGRVFTNYYFGK